MTKKSLVTLAVTAGCLVLLAVITGPERGTAPSGRIGMAVLPEMPVNDICKIVLQSESGKVVLEKSGGKWVVSSLYGIAADFERIRLTLIGIMNLRVGQELNLTDKQKKDLGLVVPGTAGAGPAGMLVDMMGADGTQIVSLLIGDQRSSKSSDPRMPYEMADGRYVSPDGGKTAYLVSDSLYDVSDDPMKWADTGLSDISSSEISSVIISRGGKDRVDLAWDSGDGAPVLKGKKRKEKLDENSVRAVREALSYLRFSGVADPALSDADLGMDEQVVFSATTTNGLIYRVKVGSSDPSGDGNYIRISAEISPDFEEQQTVAGTEETEEDVRPETQVEIVENPKEKIENRINDFNERFSSRTFIIPSYKAEVLSYDRDDMITKQEDD